MVLLTSGQVSLGISAFIVCMFTFALFLSGYVLQQRTLTSLREAVKPRPRSAHHPTIYLPKQFQDPANSENPDNPQDIVEIVTSKLGLESEGLAGVDVEVNAKQQVLKERDGNGVRDPLWYDDKERSRDSSRLSAAERRRRIKEEIEEAWEPINEGYHRRWW